MDAAQSLGRVFIVDDDEAVRSALEMQVKAFGWRCETFASAADFLERALLQPGDCLLLDLHMPGMNGVELQQALNARGTPLPTVLITAYKDDPLTAHALRAGAREILGKPFDDAELHACLERLASSRH